MNQQAIPSVPSLIDFAGCGLKTSTPFTFTRSFVLVGIRIDVGLAEDDEQVAFAGVLEVLGHVKVGVHARLEHGNTAELVELRGVRIVIERTGDQHVEGGVASLASGSDEVSALDSSELRADEDGGALLGVAIHVAAFGADEIAGPGRERSESDPVVLVGLLHAGDL